MTDAMKAVVQAEPMRVLVLPLLTLWVLDYAAKYALRIWIAVKNLEDPPMTAQPIVTKKPPVFVGRLLETLPKLSYVGLLALMTACAQNISDPLFWVARLITPFTHACFLTALLRFDRAVYRWQGGGLVYSLEGRSIKGILLPVFSLLWSWSTFTYMDIAASPLAIYSLQLLSEVSLIFVLMTKTHRYKASFKTLMLYLVAFEAMVVLFLCSRYLQPPVMLSGGAAVSSNKNAAGIRELLSAYSPWRAMCLAPLGDLLAMCLKYDYAHAEVFSYTFGPLKLKARSPRQDYPTSSNSERPTGGLEQRTGRGIVIPTKQKFLFLLPRSQRIYYNITLALTCCAIMVINPSVNFFLAGYRSTHKQVEYQRLRLLWLNQGSGIVTISLVLPIMLLVVLAVASRRGELGRLWKYQEEWHKTLVQRCFITDDTGYLGHEEEQKTLKLPSSVLKDTPPLEEARVVVEEEDDENGLVLWSISSGHGGERQQACLDIECLPADA